MVELTKSRTQYPVPVTTMSLKRKMLKRIKEITNLVKLKRLEQTLYVRINIFLMIMEKIDSQCKVHFCFVSHKEFHEINIQRLLTDRHNTVLSFEHFNHSDRIFLTLTRKCEWSNPVSNYKTSNTKHLWQDSTISFRFIPFCIILILGQK